MRPSLSKYISTVNALLAREITPQVADSYARSQIGSLSMVLSFVSREADRAADTLVKEQDALRALFTDAANGSFSGDLRKRLREAGAGQRASLRISDLEKENAALKALLIELHEAVEQRADAACAQLEKQIWAILVAGADARVVGGR